ncbi:MAG: hypothetical protein J5871_05605 [Bacteroidales bacterium]|nr:hypothetical protein [Bacteroidales bacterium]
MSVRFLLLGVLAGTLLCSSCSKLRVTSVSYQSIVNGRQDLAPKAPEDASIFAAFGISPDGNLIVEVHNLTGEMMDIDRTQSFFVNSDGSSTCFYDPTLTVNSTSTSTSNTVGATVNLGTVTPVLRGVNVGNANTSGTTNTSTTYVQDREHMTIAPRGKINMGRNFQIAEAGRAYLSAIAPKDENGASIRQVNEPRFSFGVVISYSTDGGESYETLETSFFTNNLISCAVRAHGEANAALREILTAAPEAMLQPWLLFYSAHDKKTSANYYTRGYLYNYQ